MFCEVFGSKINGLNEALCIPGLGWSGPGPGAGPRGGTKAAPRSGQEVRNISHSSLYQHAFI